MITLEDAGFAAIVDPDHGGEVLELIAPSGSRPLGRPPFAPRPAVAGDLDEDDWTDRYRGGWQLAAPNAGNPCVVSGDGHGFHGAASNARWAIDERGSSCVSLAVEVHGLRFRRRLELVRGTLRIETVVIAADGPAPLVALEHIVCGASVLDPAVRLDLPAGRAYELDEAEGPVVPPPLAPLFPRALLLDGTVEENGRWLIGEPRSRLLVVADLPEGRAEVSNTATGEGIRLRWDHTVLPHVWVWRETCQAGGRWRGQGELLGIEPSMVPHCLGLDRALAAGQALIVTPGESVSWWVELTPLPVELGARRP